MGESAPLMLSVSGCRGIFGKTITPEVVARYAMVFGTRVRNGAKSASGPRPMIVLGRDGRAGGEVLARAAAAGLSGAGCDVLDVGVAMTPTVAVMVDVRAAAAGMMITASHNPQEWNGIKPIVRGAGLGVGRIDACAPGKKDADELIAAYRAACANGAAGVEGAHVGSVSHASPGGVGIADEGTTTHLERVRDALNSVAGHGDRRGLGFKIVVDSVNASGRAAAKGLLGERLVRHLGAGDSGIFPHSPEPLKENLGGLCRAVVEAKADVGFAQDPDADRLAVIDEKGEYIGEEYTLVLCAEAVLGGGGAANERKVIVTNLSTSRMIEDVAARHGARVIRTAVGEANVVEAMKREAGGGAVVFGGEGNGGVIWPRVTYIRDSAGAMGLVLALMARERKSVSELVAGIPSYAIVKRKVELGAGGMGVAQRAADAVAKHGWGVGASIDRQDGVRVDIPSKRAWLHVRGSNTEPIMRLIAEAPERGEAEKLLDEAGEAIGRG